MSKKIGFGKVIGFLGVAEVFFSLVSRFFGDARDSTKQIQQDTENIEVTVKIGSNKTNDSVSKVKEDIKELTDITRGINHDNI